MKAKPLFGGYVLTLGFLSSQALAQSSERYAAVDPAVTATAPSAPSVEVAAPPPTTTNGQPGVAPGAEGDPSNVAPATAPATPAVAPSTPAPTALSPAPATLSLGSAEARRDAPEASTAQLPIRSQRKLALLGEVGWNSLGGWGLVMTYNAHPHLAFDLAGGFSLTGWKAGLRGRYNLLKGPFTPFIGAGLSTSSGWEGARIGGSGRDRDEHDDFDFDPTEEAKYDVKRSEFAQAVVGFEFIHRHGFTMQVTGGYSWLLRDKNYTFVTGKRDDDLASALFGSGPVASLAFGYAFD